MMVGHSYVFAYSRKGIDMSTTVAVADWVKRLAEDERARDTARLQSEATTSRKADVDRRNGQRLIGELRATVTRDVAAFRDEFPNDGAREVVVEPFGTDGGFAVRKPAGAAVSLTVTPNLLAAVLVCHFRFMLSDGLPPREDRFEVTFADSTADPPLMRHHGTGEVFASADALSEFLLVPVLTGRSR
jgi:hypothetical protein